jgi:hypothetical protein
MIIAVKKGHQVRAETGRSMGTYGTRADAEHRLKQVEFFKHLSPAGKKVIKLRRKRGGGQLSQSELHRYMRKV